MRPNGARTARTPVAAPRINVTTTHDRAANLSRRPTRGAAQRNGSGTAVVKDQNGRGPPTYTEAMREERQPKRRSK